MTRPPLSFTYAAIYGADPGSEVATTLHRLDRYFPDTMTESTAMMLCVMLRPIDLYAQVISAAEAQLHNAGFLIDQKITAMRSNEALVIAHQNVTIARLTEEANVLRAALHRSSNTPPRWAKLVIAMLWVTLLICVAIAALMVLPLQ